MNGRACSSENISPVSAVLLVLFYIFHDSFLKIDDAQQNVSKAFQTITIIASIEYTLLPLLLAAGNSWKWVL
jgi:hypothetical protein